jgi:hypothetical protein
MKGSAGSRVLCRAACGLALAAAAARAEAPAGARKPGDPPEPWTALAPLLGAWEGTSAGAPGKGTVRRAYRLVLRGRFVEGRATTSYPPQERNPKGEVHEDLAVISHDRARKAFVLRQFHVEGFVNTYVAPADVPRGGPIVFTSEAIENVPPGWRARETWRFPAPGEMTETFELAEPGKDFTVYSETRLRRLRDAPTR